MPAMHRLEEVRENFRFIVSEVTAQVELTRRFYDQPSRELMEKISSRDDYVDNLKSVIEEQSFDRLMDPRGIERAKVVELRALTTITANLERIADFAVNLVGQMGHLVHLESSRLMDFAPFFDEVLVGLDNIVAALDQRNSNKAFRICQCEFNLDKLHAQTFAKVLQEMEHNEHRGDLVTIVFISHYLERMGDCLLNIGEALIFVLVGEKMKIRQYQALSDTLAASGLESSVGQVEFESIWGTRGGCRIAAVQDPRPESSSPVLFKQGVAKKLSKEKENLELWEKLAPGLPPKVWAFQEGEEGEGSILLEYLPGCTMQDLIINGDDEGLALSEHLLEATLGKVWWATKQASSLRPDFVGQIRSRQEAVYRMHPEFKTKPVAIGNLQLPSFEGMLDTLEELEPELAAPYVVRTHGDLNLNNVIFDPARQSLHFIDLHRSALADCAQDISVFLISNFRLPVFDVAVRRRINTVIGRFLAFALDFARNIGDQAFQARLALGLGRSLFSSTRFEMNNSFAREMHLRAVYLLERVVAHRGKDWSQFKLPRQTLIYP